MVRHYTPEQKADYLQHLDDNFGNVTLTALQTGVPSRTLYTWKRERKLQAIKNGDPIPGTLRHKKSLVPPPPKADEPEDAQGEYTRLRERLMEHINNLMETLTDDPDTAHLRVVALTRLLDRVIKLEALTAKEGEQVYRIEYKYPDGTIHDIPHWENEDYDDDFETERPLSGGRIPKGSPITWE